jgi:hypothetical protein
MRARGGLTCTHRKQMPSRTAREAIAAVHRVLEQGCTPEELAQARANLDALNRPRQPQLVLKVTR